ncbi:MAG: PKD domain-containing protein [Candidatus Woesebacteria bacterium]
MKKIINKLKQAPLLILFLVNITLISFFISARKVIAQQCIEERYHNPGSNQIEGTYIFYCNQLSCTWDQGVYALRCDNSNAIHIEYKNYKVQDQAQCNIFPVGEGGYHYLPNGKACECLAYQIDWQSGGQTVGWIMDDPPLSSCSVPSATTTPTATPKSTATATPTTKPSATPTVTSTPTPTTTPSPTATPTPTGIPHSSSCDDLDIVSGNNALVPAKVKFRARGSDNKGEIKKYRFYFGDGQEIETSDSEITHKYEVSGTFQARVEVKDSVGNWKTSTACTTEVKVKSSQIESHKSSCSDIFITAGNGAYAPSSVTFQVSGYDNKGSLQAFKVDYGDNSSEEKNNNFFQKKYHQAGTYTVRAYIKDSTGNWKGGSNGCKKTLYIKTKPLTTQPETGTNTMLSISGIFSGGMGIVLQILKKRK